MSRIDDRKALRRLERADRKAHDPYFGKRRKTTMEGDKRKAHDKGACRNRGSWD